MVLDPDAAIYSKQYSVVTGDSELQTIMGGTVHFHRHHAGKDPTLPYLVDRLESMETGHGKRDGDYYIDSYDYTGEADDYTTIWEIKRRLLELLHNASFTTTETGAYRLKNEIYSPVPESEPGIVHYHSRWSLQYFPKKLWEEINS